MHIFFSNEYEKLAQKLGERLFSFSDTPLKRRYVVVNSGYVKEYLLKFFADRFQISSCIYFITLKEALSLFYSKKFPPRFEIFFSLLAKLNSPISEKYSSLLLYLEGDQKEKKILSLSHSLSQFFFDFALFPKNATHSWQEDLFHEIAEEEGWPTFTYLWEEMKGLAHTEIHFFDWDYLPKSYVLFFGKADLPIYYYLFSPCKHYWGDDLSDKELFRKKSLAFEERNPLLSNLGMMQRKFLSFLDEFDFEGEEEYVEREGSLLQKVQNEILHAKIVTEKKELFDQSLQIFSAGSKLQEVELLYQKIALAYESNEFSLEDVLVLAPDISSYLPFIHFVFWGLCEHSKRDDSYQIFLHILELSQKEGEVEEILKILESPACQKKLLLKVDDLEQIKNWLKETNTRFGLVGEESHSWEQFFFKLFERVTFDGADSIDLSQLQLMNKLYSFIESLKEDLFFLQKNPKLTLCEWGVFFEQLVERYLAFETDSFNFLYLKKTSLIGMQFDFRSMLYFLQKEEIGPKNHDLRSIRFASLEEGSPLPSKVICLLGMEEGAFPRFSKSSLNPHASHFKSAQEEDRYLFLRTVLMAKSRLLIFYKSFSEEDGRSIFPSPLLQELIRNTNVPIVHSASIPSSANREKKEEIFQLAPNKIFPLEERQVSLQDMAKLAKDPWRFYLHSLRIYLEKNEVHEFQMGEFLFSKLDHYLLRKRALSSSWKEEVEKADCKGKLPIGLFGESTKLALKEEFQEWEEELHAIGLKKEELFSVHFSLNVREAKDNLLPPLKIGEVFIFGEIPYLCKDGLLLMEKESKEAIFQNLPLLCAYLLLPQSFRPERPKIYFTKSLTVTEWNIADPKRMLNSFLTYYGQAKKELMPFRAELMDGFTKKDPALLQKAIDQLQKKHPFPNPYLEFFLKGKTLPTGEKMLSLWGGLFDQFFEGLV